MSIVDNPERVRALYTSGMTQREIAAELGVAPSTVHRAMVRHGIPSRRAIKRDQYGEKNPRWKGDRAGYNALHRRVSLALGKAASCVQCGCADSGKTYDWANLTGRYESVDDYLPMCRSCHQRFDAERRKAE